MAAQEFRSFNTGRVTLAYAEWAGDSPPVLFLHGLTAGMAFWASRIHLRGRQKAFGYDARGHGDSDRASSYRWTEFGEDAVSFLEGVCREPAILVGHSLGGMTAIYAAAERPDLVIGLLLVDPPLYAHKGSRDQEAAFEQRRALAGEPVDKVVAAGVPLNQGGLLLSKLDGSAIEHVLDGRAFADWDIERLLSNLRCPVVLEHGERGVGTGIAASNIYEGELERASALIKDCTIVEIKGSGHIPMAQQPEEFAKLVSDFIERLAPEVKG